MTRSLPDWARDVAARLGIPCRQRTSGDTHLLRALTLEHVGRRPVTAAELFERVRDDFGSVCVRRLWRALTWHVTRGSVVVVAPMIGCKGVRWTSEGYVRARVAS